MNYSSFDIDIDAIGIFDRPNMTGTPERNLLLAIVERAILDFVGNDQDESEAAESWIFDEDPEASSEQFSFPWICGQLDLNYPDIIGMIKRMPKRGSSRIAPWYINKNYAQKAG